MGSSGLVIPQGHGARILKSEIFRGLAENSDVAARARFPAETCLSRGALVEYGDDLGQVSSYLFYINFN